MSSKISSKSVKNCSFAGEGHTESRIVGLNFLKNTHMRKPRWKKIFTMLESVSGAENQTSDESQRLNE
ncbi:hypothetical protein PHMEG_0008511 [Phytophthora megakarya]|uniref:Uncharacterized protein n=1 Tax=Phytophthora megakarya TaxID=4795 RepID=A0A225WIU9_9STRA|nr:hypothetical protein PHMEG_0008511 [Phytophthora megakarya]